MTELEAILAKADTRRQTGETFAFVVRMLAKEVSKGMGSLTDGSIPNTPKSTGRLCMLAGDRRPANLQRVNRPRRRLRLSR